MGKRHNILAQIHLCFDHTRKTTKVINSTSYPTSMAFLFFFFLCCPCWSKHRFIKFHRTVSDKIANSSDFQLGTLKFLVRLLNILINKSEKIPDYHSNFYIFINHFPGLEAQTHFDLSNHLCIERLKSFTRNIQKCKTNFKKHII